MNANDKQYAQLEARITKHDHAAMDARWAFGKKLLAERGDAKRLPNGRVEELFHACKSSSTLGAFQVELWRRMTFAEKYPTKAKAREALQKFGSWHRVCEANFGVPESQSEAADEKPLADLDGNTWDLGDDQRARGRLALLEWIDAALSDARNRLDALNQHHGGNVGDLLHRLDLLIYDLDRRYEAIVHGGLSNDRGLLLYACNKSAVDGHVQT